MRHHPSFTAPLAFSILAAVACADDLPRLKSSWKEKDARVMLFSPDGRSLISSGGEGHQLRDAATGLVRAVLAGPRVMFDGPVFSPDGRTLYAEVSSDQFAPVGVGDFRAWDVATGQPRATFAHISEAMGGGHFALSADGSRLAFPDNSERLPMEVKTGKISMNHGDFEFAYNASPGLPRIVIWDVTRGERTARVDGGPPLAFTPDGKLLITGDRDGHKPGAKVWEADTGRLRLVLKDRSDGYFPIVTSPDGRFLASGYRRSLWLLADGRRWDLGTTASGTQSWKPMFTPDSRLLFADGLPRIDSQSGPARECVCYDLATTFPTRLDLGPGELVISPDGRRYAAVTGRLAPGSSQAVTLHELPSKREVGRSAVAGLEGAGFSPDGRWLAVLACRGWLPDGRSDKEIRLLDSTSALVRYTIPSPGKTWGNYGFKFSPDGSSLAVYFRTGSNVSTPRDPEPIDRPMTAEVWELPPR